MTSAPVDIEAELRARVTAAVRAALGEEAAAQDPAIHRSAHADYQADVAMALGRRLKRNPREVAAAILDKLPADDVIAAAAASGPGFINLTLRAEHLGAALGGMADERLGVPAAAAPEIVVIDYSSPNVAKEMHVGNMRTTIIGDALARVLELLGHRVIRQNHIGDWGTPFGMLVEHLHDERAAGHGSTLAELVAFYRAARAKFDGDPAFADRARRRVVLLQGGDAETLALWRRLIELSIDHLGEIYARMGVTLRPEDVRGESAYNADLPAVAEELEARGIARVSDGALCVFPPGFTGRDGEPVPLIVRKQDGGYGYATTDLAAVRYRVRALGARRVIYVVGAPQSQHFAMVFAVARMAGWAGDDVRLEHVAFGSVLGQDKKMLKTRAGDTVSVAELLDEAFERALAAVKAKAPELGAEAQTAIAEAVGMGAIKYADLASDRIKDYVFDWDRMLSFDGNTAPYLMYAHARIRSILRKAAADGGAPGTEAALRIEAPEERALALELLQLPGAVARTGETLQPHRICGQLHAIATTFTAFYEACPVLKAEPAARASRLQLAQLTARALRQGLGLLGIAAPEQM
jgi:arginyl-tRNA synthetase